MLGRCDSYLLRRPALGLSVFATGLILIAIGQAAFAHSSSVTSGLIAWAGGLIVVVALDRWTSPDDRLAPLASAVPRSSAPLCWSGPRLVLIAISIAAVVVIWVLETRRPDHDQRADIVLIWLSPSRPANVAYRPAVDDEVVWMGHPPVRVDLLKAAPGVKVADAWARRVVGVWNGVPAILISRDDVIHSKRASGREQDLIHARNLERAGPREPKPC